MKHSAKELNVRYFWLQVLFWGAAVVHYAYMTQILQSKGFTEVEIGIMLTEVFKALLTERLKGKS